MRTIKIFALIVIIGILIGSIIFLFTDSFKSTESIEDHLPLSNNSINMSPIKAKDIYSRPISVKNIVTGLSAECADEIEQLTTMPIDEFIQQFSKGGLDQSSPCLALDTLERESPMLKRWIDSCKNDPTSTECQQAAIPFRARLIDKVWTDQNDLEVMDSSILLNKIMARLVRVDATTPDSLLKIIQIADALLLKEPNLYAAYKAKTIALFLDHLVNGAKNQTQMDELMQICLKENTADSELFEMQLLLNKDNHEKREHLLTEYSDQNPKSGLGKYFEAAFVWKEHKDKAKAQALLQTALMIEPNNQRFKDALARLLRGEENSFSVTLSFGIQDN